MRESAVLSTKARGKPGVAGVLGLFFVLFLAIAAAVFFVLAPRLAKQKTLLASASADSVHMPVVMVAKVARAKGSGVLELPGDLTALNEAPLYARADGYMKRRLVDISYKVKSGQLLAELDTPELDQQIRQAEAAISQARATEKQFAAAVVHAKAELQLARVTLDRWKKLSTEGVISRQAEDEKQGDFDVKQAQVTSAEANLAASRDAVSAGEANLKRLQELKGFSRILSPFDGVITGRFADVGALINSGSANREIFRVAQIDPLRIFVSVPQSYVAPVRAVAGKPAKLTVQQLPGREFTARVAQSNSALDPNTRTMLTVLYVPNPNAELLPGMYGTVTFALNETFQPLIIPGDTVTSGPAGPQVAAIGEDRRVHLRRIEPGRDFGARMEVLSGVAEGESLVVNPTDEIREGVQVQVRSSR